MLELLLQDKTLNTSDFFFLLGKNSKPPATHYITLWQFVDISSLRNADRLLALLDGHREISYIDRAKRFLLPLLFKDTESTMDKHTQGLAPFHHSLLDDGRWYCVAYLGDLEVKLS
jgi:hypothetical protein